MQRLESSDFVTFKDIGANLLAHESAVVESDLRQRVNRQRDLRVRSRGWELPRRGTSRRR